MEDTKKKRGDKGLLVFLGCMFFVISGLAAAVVLNMNHSVDISEEDVVSREVLFDEWENYVASGDMEGLIVATDKEIEATDNAETISTTYASRAGVLYNYDVGNSTERYGSQILSDAYSAEEHYPTGQTAYLIYYYERIYGEDPVVADDYLELAKARGLVLPSSEDDA